MANIKSLIRKSLFFIGIVLIVIGTFMCINDVPPEMEQSLTLAEFMNNVINGILLISLGAILAYLAKHGLNIKWSWDK